MRCARNPTSFPRTALNTQLLNFQKANAGSALWWMNTAMYWAWLRLRIFLRRSSGNLPPIMPPPARHHSPGQRHLYHRWQCRRADDQQDLGWHLPTDGPKTLNGLITETLENIPDTNVCLKVGGHRIEVLQIKDNVVKAAIVHPKRKKKRGRVYEPDRRLAFIHVNADQNALNLSNNQNRQESGSVISG